MFGIGFSELLGIVLIGLLFFGAGRLPEIGRSLGEAIREFQKVKEQAGEDR
ncbi:MAG: twin-arginine translocase TatA/TatE family subunit [Candidatus Omnitrophica bacterium]|nr:twin-arginine translocase TatA/TatE family subunit [Candidatus Omnitrophota bacterium]